MVAHAIIATLERVFVLLIAAKCRCVGLCLYVLGRIRLFVSFQLEIKSLLVSLLQ